MVGHGSFGDVYEGLDMTGRQIAIKQVPISLIASSTNQQQKKLKALQQEIKLLKSLQH